MNFSSGNQKASTISDGSIVNLKDVGFNLHPINKSVDPNKASCLIRIKIK